MDVQELVSQTSVEEEKLRFSARLNLLNDRKMKKKLLRVCGFELGKLGWQEMHLKQKRKHTKELVLHKSLVYLKYCVCLASCMT